MQVEQQEAADLNGLLRLHSMLQMLPLYLRGITALSMTVERLLERIQCRTYAYPGFLKFGMRSWSNCLITRIWELPVRHARFTKTIPADNAETMLLITEETLLLARRPTSY